MRGEASDRFAAKVRWPSVITACWLWAANTNPDGYGLFWEGRRKVGAHRFAYELLRGPIPAGLHIDHLCRVRNCVNPLHMEAVEKRVNDERGLGPFIPNSLKTACHRGHPFTPENTYVYRRKRCCRRCNSIAVRRRTARLRAGVAS